MNVFTVSYNCSSVCESVQVCRCVNECVVCMGVVVVRECLFAFLLACVVARICKAKKKMGD